MSDDLATRFPANPAQAQYWNTGRGEQWVTHQAALDARFAGVRDQLLARAAVRPGERALDIGCGTGDDQDVGRLDVLVDEMTPVRLLQRRGERDRNPERVG
jgi:hypothetical protein